MIFTVRASKKKCFFNCFFCTAIHHCEATWPQPFEYKPERFQQLPAPGTFIPFSTGNRSCIGANFSLTEQMIAAAHVIRQMKIEFPQGFDPESVKEVTMGPTLKPSSNLRIKLTKL